MDRRTLLLTALSLPLAAQPAFAAPPRIDFYKTPTCGCCAAWADRMTAAGFDVRAEDMDQNALWDLKARAGIPPEMSSCHTGFIDGYVVEGHVPAEDIRRLIAERPAGIGLAVPGMPMGSPGMEMGTRRDAFDTLLVLPRGRARIFQNHA
ncbi:MAG: DUF411 domain-containing protein [Pseudomonadota bacterium]